MIPFNNRFHGHNSLRFVYNNGQAVRSHSIIIKFTTNPHRKRSRIAVVVSKKVLKSAVKRNKVRRRIYESIRLKLPFIKGVYDIVIIVTSGELLTVAHKEITNQIDQLFTQANIK
ncbi:MAG: ribonuclease P protein component [Candidatus Saccharibacteria bacterium]